MNFLLNSFILIIFGVLPNISLINESWQFNYPKLLLVYGGSAFILLSGLFKLANSSSPKFTLNLNLSKILIGIWFLFTLFSGFFSKSPIVSIFGDWYGPNREGMLMVCSALIFYVYFYSLPIKYLSRVLLTITLGVCFGLLWGIVNQSGEGFYGSIPLRMSSLEYNTIYFSNLISIGLPSSLSLLFLQKDRRGRVLVFLALMVISLGIILSLTRAVWISSGIILIVVWLTLRLNRGESKLQIKKTLLFLFVPTILMVIYLWPIIQNRFRETFFEPKAYNSINIRLIEYKTALRMIKDHPLGIGADTVRFIYPQYRALELNQNDKEWWSVTTFIRSYYLQQAVTIGVIGALSLAIFILSLSFSIIQTLKKSSSNQFLLMAGVFWAWLMIALNFIFYDSSITLQIIFWSLSGILAGVIQERTIWRVSFKIPTKLVGSKPLGLVLLSLIAMLILGAFGVDALSRYYFEQGMFEQNQTQRLGLVYQAIQLNPLNNNYRFIFVLDYLNLIEDGVDFRKKDKVQIEGWIKNAQDVLNDAKRINADDPQMAYKQGLLSLLALRLKTGDEKWAFYPQALADAQFAHQLNPTDPRVLDLTTLVYLDMEGKKLKEAESTALAIIQLKPNDPGGYHHLGEALKQQGRFRDAIVAYQNALKVYPDDSIAKEEIGKIRQILEANLTN